MESKHTPGPWTLIQQGGAVGFSLPNGTGFLFDDNSATDVANARLIAAAPELLSALQVLSSDSRWISGEPVIQQALAAIARATGAR